MKKKTTILDIASKLGITPSAVSKAFNNHPRISSETKKAVIEMGESLGYKPNYMATGLRKGKSGLVGMLVPGIHYSFFATAIKGAEEILSQHGYNVLIAQSKDSYEVEKAAGRIFESAGRRHNFFGCHDFKTYEHYRVIAEDTPLVLFEPEHTLTENIIITSTTSVGAVKAVDNLVEIGYRKIAPMPDTITFFLLKKE